ncbi:5-formyltetrahydrofolate cyclo-ligase [Chryseolinea sp. T2]|uniref:5-formyltetrahydrofolate cyclo-ligase n=1 Tax=Chryseolinea sp. T2 TaxID=3129255 RepID=UPI003077C0C1
MTKEEIRETYLKQRLALSEMSCSMMSHTISEKFIANFDLDRLNVLHSFIPITKNKEPDTWVIIDWIRTKYPDIRISLPRVVTKTRQLQNFYFDDRFPLKKNKWGLEEPTQGESTNIQDIDLVIVPLVAFDKKGNRVGYGKGFYDKFLAGCRPDCKRVGLSFFEAIDRIDDINTLDVPLHHCITPKEFYTF